MSRGRSSPPLRKLQGSAAVFAALGDETRIALLVVLAGGSALSITRLAEGSSLTRQAITKHLRVLEDAGLVHGVRHGRESLFELEPAPLDDAKLALEAIAQQWDQALGRLRAFGEK